MSKFDDQYISLCKRIIADGERITNYAAHDPRGQATATAIPDHAAQGRTASRTLRLPHQILQFDLSEEFPILTSKKVAFKTATLEMLWIYQQASNDVRWLRERGIKIWDEWEISEDGTYQGQDFNQRFQELHPAEPPQDFAHTIGTAYGWIVQRYDLMRNLIETLKKSPGNRRMVISLWQNEWLPTAALPSCVWSSQWILTRGRLNLLVNCRSNDVPLGLPFNISQYAVLCCLLAQCIGARPGQFTYLMNDAHIYENQLPGIREHISRYDAAVAADALPPAPTLWLNPTITDFYAFDSSRTLADIKLENYQNLGTIKMPVTE